MSAPSTQSLLRQRLDELNPRDTFELGMYRLLAWTGTNGSEGHYHSARLTEWSVVLGSLSALLAEAARR